MSTNPPAEADSVEEKEGTSGSAPAGSNATHGGGGHNTGHGGDQNKTDKKKQQRYHSQYNEHAAGKAHRVGHLSYGNATTWARARSTASYVRVCGYDCSILWSNCVLLLFGTQGLIMWCCCLVALFSFKSAVHVYVLAKTENVRKIEASKTGDGCYDASAFMQLSLLGYVNGRIALLALGILPAAVWAFKKALDWCEHNSVEHISAEKRKIDVEGESEKKDAWVVHSGRQKAFRHHSKENDDENFISPSFRFCSASFQTVAGISVFNFLAFVALVLDFMAMIQWSKEPTKAIILDIASDSKRFDPEFKTEWFMLPVLLFFTNLLATLMGTFTCIFGLTHACQAVNRQLNEAVEYAKNQAVNSGEYKQDEKQTGHHPHHYKNHTGAQFFAPPTTSYIPLYNNSYRPVPTYGNYV